MRRTKTDAGCTTVAGSRRSHGPCRPPHDPGAVLLSFADVVQDYIRQYRANAGRELAFYRGMNSLDQAIEKAGNAECEDGTKYDHQWRIPTPTLARAAKALLAKRAEISKCSNFQNLIDLVKGTLGPMKGIGELALYDTALRIGARLEIEPEYVYLHRGTRKGAKALGLASRHKYLKVSELPKEFARLKPREIEDCLCIYAIELSRLKRASDHPPPS